MRLCACSRGKASIIGPSLRRKIEWNDEHVGRHGGEEGALWYGDLPVGGNLSKKAFVFVFVFLSRSLHGRRQGGDCECGGATGHGALAVTGADNAVRTFTLSEGRLVLDLQLDHAHDGDVNCVSEAFAPPA